MGYMIKTGFKRLDKILGGGIMTGEVTVIAGRPAMYKKTLALNFALGFAKKEHNTMIFSTFLREDLMSERINKIFGDNVVDDESINIKNCIVVEDRSYLTPEYINKCRLNLKRKYIEFIIIDCFNDIMCDEWSEVAIHSHSCKQSNRNIVMNDLRKMARNADVAIILCVNLDREIEERKDYEPNMDDLSKIIDPQCYPDNVLFVYKENDNENIDECYVDKIKVVVARNRNCEYGTISYKLDVTNFKLIEEKS